MDPKITPKTWIVGVFVVFIFVVVCFYYFLDHCWSLFEVIFAPRWRGSGTVIPGRSFLDSSCCQGARLGPSWAHFGLSWAHLGPSWVIFGPTIPSLLIFGSILGSTSCQNEPRRAPKAVQESFDSDYLRF